MQGTPDLSPSSSSATASPPRTLSSTPGQPPAQHHTFASAVTFLPPSPQTAKATPSASVEAHNASQLRTLQTQVACMQLQMDAMQGTVAKLLQQNTVLMAQVQGQGLAQSTSSMPDAVTKANMLARNPPHPNGERREKRVRAAEDLLSELLF